MRKVCILGCGKTGISVLNFIRNDCEEIYLYDDNVELLNKICIQYDIQKFNGQQIDTIVVSPGIPNNSRKTHDLIVFAKQKGINITSDIEIFQNKNKSNKNIKYIGVTGTNGKSTTTELITNILKCNKLKVESCGNVGKPVLSVPAADIYVMELSSYQLDLFNNIFLNIAICINITPDHLNCYLNMQNYIASKCQIFNNSLINIVSADYDLILNNILHDKYVKFSVKEILNIGFSIKKNILYIDGIAQYDIPLNRSLIYNLENVAAAIAACTTLKIPTISIQNGISTFQSLPHRMELVFHDDINNVLYINDSKATNNSSTAAALLALQHQRVIWIVGGFCKDDGIESLNHMFYCVDKAYTIGSSTEQFYDVLTKYNIQSEKSYTLENAVYSIKKSKLCNCVVLLSPACSSTDQWINFEARGDAFRHYIVNDIL